ncbi:hypothetical protein [Streptomyces virginiae]|uniref:hypothetical protein n=1 Tax=Streptomyces virginiae TaxID=1961 RepID=UPI002F90BF19|nr:hypothetical protein OG253_42040 [Streptomyces virginiae]
MEHCDYARSRHARPRAEAEHAQGAASDRSTGPVDAARQLLHTARQAVDNATEDKAARKVRSGEEAQRQQDAIRRIGRMLSQVKVEADIVDGEVVVDAETVEG